jgi:hypothetical protein
MPGGTHEIPGRMNSMPGGIHKVPGRMNSTLGGTRKMPGHMHAARYLKNTERYIDKAVAIRALIAGYCHCEGGEEKVALRRVASRRRAQIGPPRTAVRSSPLSTEPIPGQRVTPQEPWLTWPTTARYVLTRLVEILPTVLLLWQAFVRR